MVSLRRLIYGINIQLLQDMDVYYLDKHNNQVLNINHLEKIRLFESKIEEVKQVRVAVRGPTESEEGGSWDAGVWQGWDDDDVQVRPEDRWVTAREGLQWVGVDEWSLSVIDDLYSSIQSSTRQCGSHNRAAPYLILLLQGNIVWSIVIVVVVVLIVLYVMMLRSIDTAFVKLYTKRVVIHQASMFAFSQEG